MKSVKVIMSEVTCRCIFRCFKMTHHRWVWRDPCFWQDLIIDSGNLWGNRVCRRSHEKKKNRSPSTVEISPSMQLDDVNAATKYKMKFSSLWMVELHREGLAILIQLIRNAERSLLPEPLTNGSIWIRLDGNATTGGIIYTKWWK